MSLRFLDPWKLFVAGFGLVIFGVIFIFGYGFVLDCSLGYIKPWEFLKWFDVTHRALIPLVSYSLLAGALLVSGSAVYIGVSAYQKTLAVRLLMSAVVIAALVVVAGMLLASLNRTRYIGQDSRVKAFAFAIRAAAEVYYKAHGMYGGATQLCDTPDTVFADPSVQELIVATEAKSGTDVECISDGTSYAVAVVLPTQTFSDTGLLCTKASVSEIERWCVDSTGSSRSLRGQLTGPSCGS